MSQRRVLERKRSSMSEPIVEQLYHTVMRIKCGREKFVNLTAGVAHNLDQNLCFVGASLYGVQIRCKDRRGLVRRVYNRSCHGAKLLRDRASVKDKRLAVALKAAHPNYEVSNFSVRTFSSLDFFVLGASSCSQIATRWPALTNLGRYVSRAWWGKPAR